MINIWNFKFTVCPKWNAKISNSNIKSLYILAIIFTVILYRIIIKKMYLVILVYLKYDCVIEMLKSPIKYPTGSPSKS